MKYDFGGMCIIEFYGDSCASCHAVMPVLASEAQKLGYTFFRVDVETDPECAEKFGIMCVPTAILAEDGREFARFSGYQPPEILEIWLEAKTQEYLGSKNK